MRRTASQLAASTISLVETGPRTSAAVMENSPVEMAGLRDGSWIVLGVWQRGAQSEYSGAGIPRIAEHDAQPLVVQQQRMLLRTSLNWKKLKRNKWTLLKRKKRTLLKRKGPVPLKTTTCQSPLQTMWMWMNFQDVQLGTGNHQNDFATQNLDNQY
ncbi:hypothetical protein NQZ68_027473 [Dissostichus eleginoides]|nr:hypothetical protein NQZ68_027473 [Dissostichus eleginoides]